MEAEGILLATPAKVVITDRQRAGVIAGSSAVVTDFEALLADSVESLPSERFDGPIPYLYTSGSSDERKRLCCTQKNLNAAMSWYRRWLATSLARRG